jgi:hypothetical protein
VPGSGAFFFEEKFMHGECLICGAVYVERPSRGPAKKLGRREHYFHAFKKIVELESASDKNRKFSLPRRAIPKDLIEHAKRLAVVFP